MNDFPIIDPHHHLWDLEAHRYPWLQDECGPAAFGPYDSIRHSYRIEDYWRDTDGQQVVKSVHLDVGFDPADPVGETRWLQEVADQHGFPHGIVGFADLADPDVIDTLDGHLDFANIRGIRQSMNWHLDKRKSYTLHPGIMSDPEWRRGFGLLRDRNLSFDLQLYYPQMDEAIQLANDFPDTKIILNHAGMQIDGPDHYHSWCQAMHRLAQAPNIACKISGLGMGKHDWTIEDFSPYVLATIASFGVERCMFASNFPVDKIFSSFERLFGAFKEITASFSDSEKRMLFHDNAERFYRI
jgi:predicted TIM-barrel fold metal-dependent hydrolase